MGAGLSKRSVIAKTLDITGCGRLLRSTRVWDGVLILNYHRIGDCRHSLFDRNLWSATDEEFDAQIKLIKTEFDVIGLSELGRVLSEKHGRYVMVTFDDGYRDNYSSAFRILSSHDVPATFFITTGFLDQKKVPWWDEIAWMVRSTKLERISSNRWLNCPTVFDEPDRDRAIAKFLGVYKRLLGEVTELYLDFLAEELGTGRCPQKDAAELWMTWDMIREMRANGMTFGGHTVTHPILANLPSQQQQWEVGECQRRLVEELNEPITSFSYPVGGRSSFNQFTRQALADHGFQWGFTYLGSYCPHGHQDPYALNRTAIETDVDLSQFRAITTLPQFFA